MAEGIDEQSVNGYVEREGARLRNFAADDGCDVVGICRCMEGEGEFVCLEKGMYV